MSTHERKARKRNGIPFQKTAKAATWPPAAPPSLGLTTAAEILAGIVVRGRI